MIRVFFLFFSLIHFPLADSVSAGEPRSATPRAVINNRGRNLSFDDEVLEGMNKNPLDSLENVGMRSDPNGGHLYRKRTHFKKEIKRTVHEMGYLP